MDAVALLMVGFGAFLMLEAYHQKTPTPITTLTTALQTGKPQSTKG